MKIIITGETGFICQRLIARLNNEKSIVAFYFSRSKASEVCFKIKNNNLSSVLGSDRLDDVDVLVHIAGYIPEPENKNELNPCVDANVGFTKNLIDFSIHKKIPKFILISSFAIFEGILTGTITDNSLPNPLTRYSQSKLAAEQVLLASRNEFSKGVSVLRPAFTYGTGMKPQRMIPSFVEQLTRGLKLSVRNSSALLDLSHVDDVVEAIVKSLTINNKVQVMNLVNETITKRQLVESLQSKIRSKCVVEYDNSVAGPTATRKVSSKKYYTFLSDKAPKIFSDKHNIEF